MAVQTLETQGQLAILRQKAVEGTLTRDEMIAAVKMLRADRVSAVRTTAAKGAARPKAPIPDADDMLAELGK